MDGRPSRIVEKSLYAVSLLIVVGLYVTLFVSAAYIALVELSAFLVLWIFVAAPWPESCVGPSRTRSFGCDFITSVLMWLMFAYYLWLANHAGAAPMGMRPIWSPDKQSTCSMLDGLSQDTHPTNPHSIFKFDDSTTSDQVTAQLQAFFQSCPATRTGTNDYTRWADNDCTPINAYQGTGCVADTSQPCTTGDPSCADLPATTVGAWGSNKGLGLDEVWPGVPDGSGCKSTTDSVAYCAGTSPVLNDGGCLGYGRITCSLCTNYFLEQGLLENPEIIRLACPESLYADATTGMCWNCPGSYFFRLEPTSATHLSDSTIVLFAFAMGFTLSRLAALVVWLSGVSAQEQVPAAEVEKKEG